MYKITLRKELNPTVTMMEIEAPLVAKRQNPVSSSFCASTKTARESP